MNVFLFLSLLGSAGALKAYKIKLSSDGLAKNAKKETSSTYSDSTQMLTTNGAMKDQALIQAESQETVFWRGKKKRVGDYTKFLDHMTQFYGNVSQDDSACLTSCWGYGLGQNLDEKVYSMTFVFGALLTSDSQKLKEHPFGGARRGGRKTGSDVPMSQNQSFGCREATDPDSSDYLFFSDSASHDCFLSNSLDKVLGNAFDQTRGVCVPWDSFGTSNCILTTPSMPVCMAPTTHVYKLKCTRNAPSTPAPATPTQGNPTPRPAPTPGNSDDGPPDGDSDTETTTTAPGDDDDNKDPTTVISPTPSPKPTVTPPNNGPNAPPPSIVATPRPTQMPTPQPPTPSPTKWSGDTDAIRRPPTPPTPWHCEAATFPERDAMLDMIFGGSQYKIIQQENATLSEFGGICADGRVAS